MTQVKSININSVFDKKTVKENFDKPLVNVTGIAYEPVFIHTKFGEQTGFKGDFVAVNLLNGAVYESNCVFLPKQFTQTLMHKLEAAQNTEVEFSVCLKATSSDKNPSGYAWIADMPDTQERMTRRQLLLERAQQQAAQLALPAPKKAGIK